MFITTVWPGTPSHFIPHPSLGAWDLATASITAAASNRVVVRSADMTIRILKFSFRM
jgi:hypothetical protein